MGASLSAVQAFKGVAKRYTRTLGSANSGRTDSCHEFPRRDPVAAIWKMLVTLRNQHGADAINRLRMRPHHQTAYSLGCSRYQESCRHPKYPQTHPDRGACEMRPSHAGG